MLVLAACSVVPYKIVQWFSQPIHQTLLNQVPFEEYLINLLLGKENLCLIE